MAAEGKVKIRIEGDAVHFDTTMTGVEGRVSKMDSIFQGIGQAAGQQLASGVAQLPGLITGTIDKASDLNETIAKTGVLFGEENVQALEDWAGTGAEAFGQSKQQALDAAATFAVFGKSAGLAGDDLKEFSTSQVQLASDLASFHNTSPEDAIQAIGAALRGEAEPMRRYGVLLDDASMRQKALEMGIISTTKEAFTPSQKVLAAQALITEQTADAQGDFARTSEGMANTQRSMTAEWENMQVQIGEKLLPVKMQLLDIVANYLLPALVSLGGIVQTVGTFLMEHKEILIGVAIGVATVMVPSIIAWAAAQWAAATAVIATAAPIIALAAVIAALVAGVIWAYQNVGWFRDAVDAMKNAAMVAFGWLRDNIPPIIQTVVGWIVGFVGHIIEIGTTAWDITQKVIGFFGDLAGGIGSVIGNVADVLTSPFREAFNAIASLWNSTVASISFSVPDWVPGIGGKGFSIPKIPTFAEGGLAFSPMLAVVGDHKSGGAEIITPEAKMRQVIREEGGGAGISIGTINMGRGTPQELAREIDWMWRTRKR